MFSRSPHMYISYINSLITILKSGDTTIWLCIPRSLLLQILRRRPLLPVRQQDPVRVRLRGAHGLRQPRLQLQQPRPDEESGHQGHRAPATAPAAHGADGGSGWKGKDYHALKQDGPSGSIVGLTLICDVPLSCPTYLDLTRKFSQFC